MNLIHVVSFDPSLSNWGICKASIDIDTMQVHAIHDLILVKTTPEKDKTMKKLVRKNSEDLERGRALYRGMVEHCKGAAIAIAEVPVGSQSARAMASYGMCCGVLAACPLPLIEVTPNEVKLAAVGHRQAAKEEMIEWGMAKYPLAPWIMKTLKGQQSPTAANEHLADAVAALHAGIETQQFAQAAAMLRGLMKAA